MLYRARVFFQDMAKFEEAMKRPDRDIGPPPPSVAVAGRMNAAGISVFYGATHPGVALAEVQPPVGSKSIDRRF
jgi:RES domain